MSPPTCVVLKRSKDAEVSLMMNRCTAMSSKALIDASATVGG